MRTYKLIGTMNTIQPVNITMPNTKGMPTSKGLPMIPASSIRGWLRHAAHNAVKNIFAKDGRFLDVDTHYLLASGVDTGRVLGVAGQSTKVGANHQIRIKHPMLSTWGYWGLAGKVAVGSAVAGSREALLTVSGGARQHVFNRNEGLSGFINKDELDHLQDILSADAYSAKAMLDYKIELKKLKKEISNTSDKEEKAEIRVRIGEVEEMIDQAKESRAGAKESVQRPLDFIEAIDEGQVLPHRIIVKNPNEYELDLVLWSIAMASIHPFIGGHNNANFGEISAEWELRVSDIDNLTPKVLGKIGFNDDGFYSDIEGFDVNAVTKKIADGTINIGSFVDEYSAIGILSSVVLAAFSQKL